MLTRLLTFIVLFLASVCHAQTYPQRPITLVVPTSAGGALDLVGRVLADAMSKSMGQPVLVDNKTGAGGVLAAQTVARAAPDGYTLLLAHSGALISAPFLLPKMPFNYRTDFTPISEVVSGQIVVAVRSDMPIHSLRELVEWARKSKDPVSFGSYGVGTIGHLVGSQINRTQNLSMTHIPYRGDAAVVQDLVGGQLTWSTVALATVAPHVRSGHVRLLAVLSDKRLSEFIQVPTVIEAGFNDAEFRPPAWAALLGPAGMPQPIVARLEKELLLAMQTDAFKSRLRPLGFDPIGTGSEALRAKLTAQIPMMERMLKEAGAKADN